MDLEILRFIVSTSFLLLLLWKQNRDGIKIEQRFFDGAMALRAMPRIAEATVEAQAEMLTQMRLVTKRLEAMKTTLDVVAERISSPEATTT